MASLAHAIALECPQVRADVVEVSEYPYLAQRYEVRAVPKTVINDIIQIAGAVPEVDFVARVLQAGVRDTEPGKS